MTGACCCGGWETASQQLTKRSPHSVMSLGSFLLQRPPAFPFFFDPRTQRNIHISSITNVYRQQASISVQYCLLHYLTRCWLTFFAIRNTVGPPRKPQETPGNSIGPVIHSLIHHLRSNFCHSLLREKSR
jgi:hypothetical protein